jgi:hypothetical protein
MVIKCETTKPRFGTIIEARCELSEKKRSLSWKSEPSPHKPHDPETPRQHAMSALLSTHHTSNKK